MRTTITLDEDIYQFAKLYAKERGITPSKAVCELVRKRAPNGLLIFAGGDKVITSEMVKAALEEDD